MIVFPGRRRLPPGGRSAAHGGSLRRARQALDELCQWRAMGKAQGWSSAVHPPARANSLETRSCLFHRATGFCSAPRLEFLPASGSRLGLSHPRFSTIPVGDQYAPKVTLRLDLPERVCRSREGSFFIQLYLDITTALRPSYCHLWSCSCLTSLPGMTIQPMNADIDVKASGSCRRPGRIPSQSGRGMWPELSRVADETLPNQRTVHDFNTEGSWIKVTLDNNFALSIELFGLPRPRELSQPSKE